MVKSYLEKCKQELLELQINLANQIQKKDMLMKEKMELIQYIESSEDKSFDSFSPQNFRVDINRQKIKKMKEDMSLLEGEMEELKNRKEYIDTKLDELESVIQLCRDNINIDTAVKKNLDDDEILHFKLLEIQELERQRIARDLHDSAVQNLTALIHRVTLCSKLMDMDISRCRVELQNISNTLRDTIKEMRETIYNLHPVSMDDLPFDEAIQREMERLLENSDLDFSVTAEGNFSGIIPVVFKALFRIIQEACNNTIHHADASHIWITIQNYEDRIYLEIKDDGCGFDVKQIRQENELFYSGFGLSSMCERVYLLSGTIDIQSKINSGTCISVVVPKNGVVWNEN